MCSTNAEHHHHTSHIELHLHGSLIAAVALLLALSVHSILAGFSLGLDGRKSAEATAIALCAHKMFAGYALGSTMTASEMSGGRYYLMACMFAMSAPCGVFIALGISNFGNSAFESPPA
jgi:zinc transporter ZupT